MNRNCTCSRSTTAPIQLPAQLDKVFKSITISEDQPLRADKVSHKDSTDRDADDFDAKPEDVVVSPDDAAPLPACKAQPVPSQVGRKGRYSSSSTSKICRNSTPPLCSCQSSGSTDVPCAASSGAVGGAVPFWVRMTRGNSRFSCSSPESPDQRVKFTFGSDQESDGEEEPGTPCTPLSAKSHQSTSSTTSSITTGSGTYNKQTNVATRRNRFKKMLRPLRRSHSAGCNKDVPAHALFLRHEFDQKRVVRPERRSLDRSSMDRKSSESDSEDTSHSGDKKGGRKKKSLAQDVRDRLAFLRRRHTDTSLDGSSSDSKGSGRPTPADIVAWSKKFDNLLSDPYGLELFREYLRMEFSEENLEFWIACEEYKQQKSAKLEARANKIFTDFVAVQAPREINLDSKTRSLTEENLSSPNRHTFEQAQKRIQALMAKDSYRRFLESEVYQGILTEYKINAYT